MCAADDSIKILVAIRQPDGMRLFLGYEESPHKVPFRALPKENRDAVQKWIEGSSNYHQLNLERGYFEDTITNVPIAIILTWGVEISVVMGISFSHRGGAPVFRITQLKSGHKEAEGLRTKFAVSLKASFGEHLWSLPIFVVAELHSPYWFVWNRVLTINAAVVKEIFTIDKPLLIYKNELESNEIIQCLEARTVLNVFNDEVTTQTNIDAYKSSRFVVKNLERYRAVYGSPQLVDELNLVITPKN